MFFLFVKVLLERLLVFVRRNQMQFYISLDYLFLFFLQLCKFHQNERFFELQDQMFLDFDLFHFEVFKNKNLATICH